MRAQDVSNEDYAAAQIVGKRAAVGVPVALTLAQPFSVLFAHLQIDAMKGERPALHHAPYVAIAQVGTDDFGG